MTPRCHTCEAEVRGGRGGYDHLTGRWDCGAAVCYPADATRRAPVLEVTGGVPVIRRVRGAYGLEAGRRGRLVPGGPTVVVDRVTEGAAYVHKVYDPPLVKEFGREDVDAAVPALLSALEDGTPDEAYRAARAAGRAAGAYRAIKVTRGPVEPGISRMSFLYPAPPAPEGAE